MTDTKQPAKRGRPRKSSAQPVETTQQMQQTGQEPVLVADEYNEMENTGQVREPLRNPSRKPLGSRRRLDVSHIENDPRYANKKLGWYNNEGGRIQQLMQQGWEPVRGDAYQSVWQHDAKDTSQTDSVISAPVGIGREGQPINAILMMIDRDIYDEIQGMKEDHLGTIERSLRQGATKELGTSEQGVKTYAPETGVGQDKGFTVRNE